ncbi:hypothetical protein [Streptomyces goshikiensis]
MNTKRVTAAEQVLHAARVQGRVTAAGLACALESAQLLQSPESAAELARLLNLLGELSTDNAVADELCRALEERATRAEARVAALETERHQTNAALSDAAEALRADRDRIAELEAERSRPAPVLNPVMGPGQQRLAERTMAELEATHYRRLGLNPPSVEDPHDSLLHHTYRLGHDLPEIPHA